jgi:soluble lytic murein transglycosylase-like protein
MGLYKLCTISWLSLLGEYSRLWMMRNRLFIVPGAILAVGIWAFPASAEDKIQAFVNPYGKVVFTNLVDNTTSPPPVRRDGSESGTEDMPPSLKSLVDTISANHGVDAALVRAVMKTESNFNRYAVSNKGALGLMQLIPSTGRRYGVRDFFDPQQNIDGGVRHLKFLLEKFNGDLDLSLAAYNAGENVVERLGRVPSIPETTNYVRRIRAIYKKKSAPVVGTTSKPAVTATADQEPSKIFRMVDSRGVVHFSNIEPPN